MSKNEIIKWLQSLKKDIGQPQHQDLWHYAEMLDEVIGTIEVSEDCISRGWVIEKMLKEGEHYTNNDIKHGYHNCEIIVYDAPSVVPSRAEGEWKRYMGDIWTCTACGENLMCDDIKCNNYCPNCGAEMRKPPTEEIGDCNVCRFAGCSECDDCVDGSEWRREVKGVDYDYEEQERLYDELADMRGSEE